MKISVIIPTINRYEDLQNTIKYLLNQVFDSFEIIIIDQTDKIDELVVSQIKSHNIITYIQSTNKSASAARNVGINKSKGDVILFVDDDVIIEDHSFLKKHYRHYKDLSIFGVYGSPIELSTNGKVTYNRHWMSLRNSIVSWLYFPSNYGCNTFIDVGRSNNLSVRKDVAIAVGGMDENYEKGAHREEGDFCLRVSQKYGNFLFDPQAKLIHIGNKTGGIRSWNDNDYIKAEHNMVGAIYFNFKMAPLRYRIEYLYASLRYLILNKTILSRPHLYFSVLKRYLSATILAYRKYKKGPIYIRSKK